MDFQKIQEYFNDVVKRFPPFENSRLYQALINYIRDYYLKEHYEDFPKELKSLYEDSQLLESVYDQLLISLGVYENVVKNLNVTEKSIFLSSLSDFFRYKSSISFFQKVAQYFPDHFDIHELFIDYDEFDQKWVLRPYAIYQDEYSSPLDATLDYEETKKEVPSLLVSTDQLNTYYSNNNIVLPCKSNLILLSYSFVTEIEELNNLAISTFLKQFGNEVLSIYFTSESYNITFNNLYRLWYYLVWKLYEEDNIWKTSGIESLLHYSTESNPYTIQDVEEIFNQLDDLETTNDIYNYFEQNVVLPFLTNYQFNDYGISNYREFLVSQTGDLVNYVDERISGLYGDDLKKEVNNILNEIYNSLILYQFVSEGLDSLKLKYFDIFISSLPQVAVNPENSSSYLILHNFKPYHAELVTQSFTRIWCRNNLQKVVPDDSIYSFLIELIMADYIDTISDLFVADFTFNYSNSILPMEQLGFTFKSEIEDYGLLYDKVIEKTKQTEKSIMNFSDNINFQNVLNYNNFVPLSLTWFFRLKTSKNSTNKIYDDSKEKIINNPVSIEEIIENFEFLSKQSNQSNILLQDISSDKSLNFNFDEYKFNDENDSKISFSSSDDFTSNDILTTLSLIEERNSLNMTDNFEVIKS